VVLYTSFLGDIQSATGPWFRCFFLGCCCTHQPSGGLSAFVPPTFFFFFSLSPFFFSQRHLSSRFTQVFLKTAFLSFFQRWLFPAPLCGKEKITMRSVHATTRELVMPAPCLLDIKYRIHVIAKHWSIKDTMWPWGVFMARKENYQFLFPIRSPFGISCCTQYLSL